MKAMEDLTEEEMAEKIKEIKKICADYCGNCPSYMGTGEEDLGFCAIGKSKHITEEKGCLCGSCPVTENMSLRWGYYCTRGSGREQAKKE